MLFRIIWVIAPAIILMISLLALYLVGLNFGFETVSISFLIGFPIISAIIIMYFRPKGTMQSFGKSLVWLFGITIGSLALSMVSGLETALCIAIAALPILLGTMIGGVIYMSVLRWREKSNSMLGAFTFPILFLLLLGADTIESQPKIHEISTHIIIDAEPAVVFGMLKSVPDIKPEEIPFRASHLLGFPTPTSAVWHEGPDKTLRHSHWGPEVHFMERITDVQENRRIAWEFEFPEGWISDRIEDPHIKVGGPYFDILTGEYNLSAVGGGKTRLSLKSRTYDNSGFGFYAEFWHRYLFEDFHEVILNLIKARTEALS